MGKKSGKKSGKKGKRGMGGRPQGRGGGGARMPGQPQQQQRGGAGVSEAKLRTIFTQVDKDGSGCIDAGELTLALSNGSWEPFNTGTVNLFVGLFDKNGDGVISYPEFRELWDYVVKWETAFKRSDVDGSGAIGPRELSQALENFGYRLSPNFVAFLMDRLDRSGQDQLRFDDFVEACVLLQTVTATFKDRDTGRVGRAAFAYEDFLTDVIGLVFRLQANYTNDANPYP